MFNITVFSACFASLLVSLSSLSLGLFQPKHQEFTEITLDWNHLGQWGLKKYGYKAPGMAGILEMSTTVEEDSVLIHDQYIVDCRGERVEIDLRIRSQKDNFLTPLEATITIQMEPETWCDLGKGSATVTFGDFETTARDAHRTTLPPKTILESAMRRLVTVLPRIEGRAMRVSKWGSLFSGTFDGEFWLECLGQEEATGFTLFRLSQQVGAESTVRCDFWIDENSVLRKVVLDGSKTMELMGR